ncbi:arylsulfatase [Compostibacter hankyongensis]|uniref:Arylsulfatase n=1 Tax=Compostibacter hankyongensis TaxID=1007089 RepID=A0ABP8FMN1_9BACT
MYRPILILLLFCLPAQAFCQAQQTKKPNIIIILADDMGWGDVGFHGSEIRTPNIDRLAQEGVVLDQFYTAPICSPTRAGIMTGRYPNRFGLRQNVIPPWSKFGVDTSEVFLPQMLADAGYKNRAAIGKWHLGAAYKKYLPLHRGFTHFYGLYNGAFDYFTHQREGELDWHNDSAVSRDKGYSTDLITDEAVKCIRTYAAQSPFFLYVAYNAPHGPLQAKKEDLLRYGFDESKPLFPHKGAEGMTGRGNTPRQTYAAMVTCMDRGIGKILQTLQQLDIDKNTIVLFFSDNGAARNGGGSHGDLRGWKFQEWSGGVRAPAVIRWPEGLKEPGMVRQVMGYVDIAPTLLAVAGVKSHSGKPFDGINMLPVLEGKKDRIDRYFYLGHGAIIGSPWKLVKAHAGNPQMKEGEDALFNILNDPSEKKNVRTAHPEIYERLKAAVKPYDDIQPTHRVPPYGEGRKGFAAPKDWLIEE